MKIQMRDKENEVSSIIQESEDVKTEYLEKMELYQKEKVLGDSTANIGVKIENENLKFQVLGLEE